VLYVFIVSALHRTWRLFLATSVKKNHINTNTDPLNLYDVSQISVSASNGCVAILSV